jgi:hypothetical protein
MAFDMKGVGKLGNQSRRGASAQYYTYRTTDTAATVGAMNYFSDLSTQLEVGDIIEVQHVASLDVSPVAITGTKKYQISLKINGFILASDVTNGAQILTTVIPDVSLNGGATVPITVAVAGTITGITAVLGGTITTANSAITFNIGGVAITNSAITAAFATSTAGTTFTSAPSGANVLAAGNVLNAITDGGSTGAQPLYIIYRVTP